MIHALGKGNILNQLRLVQSEYFDLFGRVKSQGVTVKGSREESSKHLWLHQCKLLQVNQALK